MRGSEVDGASYQKSGSVRDRDRLRGEHLQRLGWRYHRLWSTTWFRDPEGEAAKVQEAYEKAVSGVDAGGAEAGEPTAAPTRDGAAEATEATSARTATATEPARRGTATAGAAARNEASPATAEQASAEPEAADPATNLATAQAGALYYDVLNTGLWLGSNVRYDSGLVSGVGPADIADDPDNSFAIPFINTNHAGTGLDPYRIKARTIVDFQVGYDLNKIAIPLQLQFMVLNAFDVQGLYNILSTFGGTHVIPPRRFVGQALVHF